MKHRASLAAILLLILISLACCASNPVNHAIAKTSNMRTHCISRFLIDLPEAMGEPDQANATFYYGSDEDFQMIGVDLKQTEASFNSFSTAVGNRGKSLAEIVNSETGKSNLISSFDMAEQARMLRHYRSTASTTGIVHELHVLTDATYIVLTGTSFEGVTQDPTHLTEAVENRLERIASNIRTVSTPAAESSPGFCLGPVVINTDNDFEQASFRFKMEKHPDVTLSLGVNNQERDSESLLDRMRVFSAYEGQDLSVLRSGKREFAGMPAEEILAEITEKATEFHFNIESLPESVTFTDQNVAMSLTTGGEAPDGQYLSSSLNKAEAVRLWDTITDSLEHRPGAVTR